MASHDPVSNFTQLLDELERLRIAYALVGGLALSAYITPRFTKDVDVAVALADPRHQDRLVRELRAAGYKEQQVLHARKSAELVGIRFCSPHATSQEPDVDLLFFATGAEQEIVERAERIELYGRQVPTATLGDLIAMKVLSASDRREQDRVDLSNLLKVAKAPDLEQARNMLDLITERGKNDERDLHAELAEHIKRRRSLERKTDLSF